MPSSATPETVALNAAMQRELLLRAFSLSCRGADLCRHVALVGCCGWSRRNDVQQRWQRVVPERLTKRPCAGVFSNVSPMDQPPQTRPCVGCLAALPLPPAVRSLAQRIGLKTRADASSCLRWPDAFKDNTTRVAIRRLLSVARMNPTFTRVLRRDAP